MKKRSFGDRFRYWFDRMMSKGTVSMTVLLFAVTAVIVCLIGLAGYLLSGEDGILSQIWYSMMYTLDAGNLSGVSTDNVLYLLAMFLATLCGLFLTSILIGIIAAGIEKKLNSLSKGMSVVQEDDHTVIIGFDSKLFVILNELIEANANKKKACIVVLGEKPKEEMEEEIAFHFPDTGTTRIICRSGVLHETAALKRCSVETSRSVIINVSDDSETVKIVLALSAYLKDKTLRNRELRFIAALNDPEYIEPAEIAGEGRTVTVYLKDALARIIANTCRQHGLSQVLTELFNFSGNEFYFETVPELDGKTFHEALLSFSNAVAVGLYSKDRVYLNPPMDMKIEPDDRIILLENDDGEYVCHPAVHPEETIIHAGAGVRAEASDHLLVFGSNDKLPIILREYAKYVKPGTRVTVVDDDADEEALGTYAALDISICRDPVTASAMLRYLEQGENNILLVSDDSTDPEESDSATLLKLILLRDISDKKHCLPAITTEMFSTDNQRLASRARVDDFVIGSSFSSLLMAQISENPMLISLYKELLDESGSELYLKPASEYVTEGVPVDMYTLTESAARKGEIMVGYRKPLQDVIVNPPKKESIVFEQGDQIVVIAEN